METRHLVSSDSQKACEQERLAKVEGTLLELNTELENRVRLRCQHALTKENALNE
jgi:hypothetical protein